jgi:hypothetical protein
MYNYRDTLNITIYDGSSNNNNNNNNNSSNKGEEENAYECLTEDQHIQSHQRQLEALSIITPSQFPSSLFSLHSIRKQCFKTQIRYV